LKTTKNLKVFALILLTSMLLIVAVIPNIQSVKAATTYTVTVFASCAGTTTPAASTTGPYGEYSYAAGSVQTFTATPGTGFQFLCWVLITSAGGTTSTSQTLSYTLNSDVAIQAVFIPSGTPTATATPATAPSTYSVTLFTSAGGSTTPSGTSTTAPYVTTSYKPGTVETYTAAPGTDFKFLCWLVVGSTGGTTSTSTTLSYTVNQDVAIQALFIPTSSTVTLPTPTPTVNEFSSAAILVLVIALLAVAFGTYTYTKRTKN
jgi:hypothetical protein